MPVPGTMKRAPNRLLMVCVVLTTLPLPSATVRCVVSAPSAACRPPVQRMARARSMPARRCVGVVLGHDALDRHLHEVRIAARLGAVGEGDLQHLGQQMQRVDACRSPACAMS